MREWSLKQGDPLSLTLAFDARLGPTDYTDDQIWELSLAGGDPFALAFQTTFGLRARSFRIFPCFIEAETQIIDPRLFTQPPVIQCVQPNFVALNFTPFPGIDVHAEYWVPKPKTTGGQFVLTNQGKHTRKIHLEIIGQLSPTTGQRMSAIEEQGTLVLAGETGGLAPVIFLTGGAKAGTGSFPSLVYMFEIGGGETHKLIWTQAALSTRKSSFELARALAAHQWDASRARLELLNSSLVEIFTGDPDWDAALMLSQKQAFTLVLGSTRQLPYSSFVISRQPDQGFSPGGDGKDYNHLWNGQSPLEAYYLSSFFLPGAPDLAKQILRNFLAVQDEDGWIDWKPGLAGQRSSILATPILASLAWRIYEHTEDLDFLIEVFPGLVKFMLTWFKPLHDRDNDSIPEWDHVMQTGSEDSPAYSHWHDWSYGVDITTAESPALAAYLYREGRSLIQIASLIQQIPVILDLQPLVERMRLAVENSWNETISCYQDVDRDTHLSSRREFLGHRDGPGIILIEQSYIYPVRPQLHIQSHDGLNRRPLTIFHGTSASGQPRVEQIAADRFKWYLGRSSLTVDRVYHRLEKVEILNLEPGDHVELYTSGYDHIDQTCLLPLWAGVPVIERARDLVENTIQNSALFWHPAGLSAYINSERSESWSDYFAVHPIWNTLIGEGLIHYGFREIAAELTSRLIKNTVINLKQDGCFRRYYHPDSRQGIGERNTLHGLAPLGLLLEVIGVRFITPQRIALNGFNPFPWPVTVKYRGTTVLCQKDKTTVIFQDGQTVVSEDPSPHIITLQSIEP